MPNSAKPGSYQNRPKSKIPKSRSKANAIGYEKRQARKARANISAVDVYEHIPEKTKRSNLKPDLDHEEAREFGENIDRTSQEGLMARLVGENVDEGIASEDDEEIESDDAFEESDEDRFAGSFSTNVRQSLMFRRDYSDQVDTESRHTIKQRGKSTVHFAEVDLNEDEEMDPQESDGTEEEDEEEVGDDDQFMNLVDILDGKGEIDAGSDQEKSSQMQSDQLPFNCVDKEPRLNEDEAEDANEVAFDEDEDYEDDGGEEMAFSASEDEEVPSALDQLQTFVSNLDVTAKKRKAPDEADGAAVEHKEGRTRKRRLLQEKTEAGEENEFHVRSSGE
jgi:U3 small nucleolar RNA-associated protein 14